MSKKMIFSIIITLLSVGFLFFIFNSKELDKPNYTNINMKDFQNKINAKEEFRIYVYKTSCSACQNIKPSLNEVIDEEKATVFAINMESDGNMDIDFLKKNNISKTPTLLLYKNGQEIRRLEGTQSKKELKNFIGKLN